MSETLVSLCVCERATHVCELATLAPAGLLLLHLAVVRHAALKLRLPILYSKPLAPGPQPWTQNPQSATRNPHPKPQTLNPKPLTLNP